MSYDYDAAKDEIETVAYHAPQDVIHQAAERLAAVYDEAMLYGFAPSDFSKGQRRAFAYRAVRKTYHDNLQAARAGRVSA